ncbi:MAG: hypothetical protein A3I11_02455 [Elusimicrobia bacterium RIFCSPLOWO2_02_FULL_39_32]|nr:MAG: hypothetical protein A3B80_07340 [Elusimicrobia bacterium RIFCSPHIGHO2_02_FULL_39_36]OGR92238.1 MAG: hypothetical protein A3I11_02455 [Elusimicrobia bacterium RIFCSPLOWO2_02_FULL_39_32]OGR99895.1 MAG: hypothetical protein A3G85_02985 [Elusimicrobia bacterium RIFCSPLOWO2_12_FULL_39_28]
MKKIKCILSIFIIFGLIFFISGFEVMAKGQDHLGTEIMEHTYLVIDSTNNKNGDFNFGTCFLIAAPLGDRYVQVLVTANHVLKDMLGNDVIVKLRTRGDNKKLTPFDYKLPIRSGGKELWVKHKNADVAVIHSAMPDEYLDIDKSLIPTIDILADDDHWKNFHLKVGAHITCVGYPGAFSSQGSYTLHGYPVLRTGAIASYPPNDPENSFFMLDRDILGGNSGGPCFYNGIIDTYKGDFSSYEVRSILGLVTHRYGNVKNGNIEQPFDYTGVVHAKYIKETIHELLTNKK